MSPFEPPLRPTALKSPMESQKEPDMTLALKKLVANCSNLEDSMTCLRNRLESVLPPLSEEMPDAKIKEVTAMPGSKVTTEIKSAAERISAVISVLHELCRIVDVP